MENIINQLRDLPGDGLINYCIRQWINTGMSGEAIIKEIKSIAVDNPPMIERILGTELFNQIQNVAV